MNIRQFASLKNFNTLGFECKAEWFIEAHSQDEIAEALAIARQKRWPVFVLGGGSNVVLPETIPGLTLRLCNQQLALSDSVDTDSTLLRADAGANWHSLVLYSIENEAYGLENLSLIPGTAGAAPVQNIGAYGVELCEHFDSLQAINTSNGESITLSKTDCQFGYRDSIFKNSAQDQFVISQITLKLQKKFTAKTSYQALQSLLQSNPENQLTASKVSDAVCQVRSSKLPDPAVLGNAGSFFKNPLVPAALLASIQAQWPNAPLYPQANGSVKIAAGWMIEQAGWKGHQRNAVGVHSEQALVLTHKGGGKSAELMALASDIKSSVKQQFGIDLEQEPKLVIPSQQSKPVNQAGKLGR